MCVRYLGLVFLVWFPGILHAQSATQPCPSPILPRGYFLPGHKMFSHGNELYYACDNGSKPAVEGWWATSICQNGKWSHQPKCIDEGACYPPSIPNAKYTDNTKVWYENGKKIRITCDNGYTTRDRGATTICTDGLWTSVPVCEKTISACGEPPIIPHAVIIDQDNQEVFPVDSELQYECEDGYTVEGADSKKAIVCIAGNWTEGPQCRVTRQNSGHGRSTVGGTGGGDSTSAGKETLPAGGDRETGREHSTSAGRETQPAGGDRETGREHSTSAGRDTQPAGGDRETGSSTTSNVNERDSGPLITLIKHCGAHPYVLNGVLVQEQQMSLKYQCNSYYTQIGLDTVVCYSDGSWSQLPICKDAFCVVEPARYADSHFKEDEFVKEGDTKNLPCIYRYYYRSFRCTNKRLYYTECCHEYHHRHGNCLFKAAEE